MTDEQFKVIPLEEYKELLNAQKVLDALYSNGVDNWEWFGDALESIEWDDE